jgi:molecular chaperone GrpE (heat shock protein)
MKWLSSLRRDAAESPDGGVQAEVPVTAPVAETIRRLDDPEAGPPEGEATSAPIPAETRAADTPTETRSETSPNISPVASAESLTGESVQEIVTGAIRSALQPLGEGQKALQDQFAARIRSDEVQAKALETLHDDLKQYKSNFVRQQMLPLLKEVIFCHDFVAAQFERASGEEASAASPATNALSATKQMLLDLLFKYDVEPFQGESEQFDPKNQQCARTVPTGRAEADKMIAGRVQAGFRSPDGIVRREQVTVFKFTPGAE